jgi:hypothetical protein
MGYIRIAKYSSSDRCVCMRIHVSDVPLLSVLRRYILHKHVSIRMIVSGYNIGHMAMGIDTLIHQIESYPIRSKSMSKSYRYFFKLALPFEYHGVITERDIVFYRAPRVGGMDGIEFKANFAHQSFNIAELIRFDTTMAKLSQRMDPDSLLTYTDTLLGFKEEATNSGKYNTVTNRDWISLYGELDYMKACTNGRWTDVNVCSYKIVSSVSQNDHVVDLHFETIFDKMGGCVWHNVLNTLLNDLHTLSLQLTHDSDVRTTHGVDNVAYEWTLDKETDESILLLLMTVLRRTYTSIRNVHIHKPYHIVDKLTFTVCTNLNTCVFDVSYWLSSVLNSLRCDLESTFDSVGTL